MTSLLLVPLDGGFGHHGPMGGSEIAVHSGGFAHLIGSGMFLLFTLLLIGSLLFLLKRGHLAAPPWLARRTPEADARQILAERFARGDIGSDEFMERASVLNWTPGSEQFPPEKRRRKPR